MSKPEKDSNILIVAAHPDDIDFGASSTLAMMVEFGCNITYCVVTDGDAGGIDKEVTRNEVAELRRREQINAAKVVGVSDVRFLGYKDGYVTADHALRRDLTKLVREIKPSRVIAPSPDRAWQRIPASHPDHLAVGEALISVIYPDARNPFSYPELVDLDPFVVDELWLMGSPYAFSGPTALSAIDNSYYGDKLGDVISPLCYIGHLNTRVTAIDITNHFNFKVQALLEHKSQTGHMENLEQLLRSWLSAAAKLYGLGENKLAEVFQIVTSF
jgi:LmbE family N-acetylglucosaminyl deacetylase